MTKRKLGKGLGAFFPEGENITSQDTDQGVVELPLNLVHTNPNQPRKEFDEDKLSEMAETMANYGVIQPIIVQKRGDGYILVAGERRLRAAAMAGLKTIPAIVKDFPADQVMAIALIENLQREDLNPIEEANACRMLLHEYGLTQEELASRLGKSRSAIANSIRLLALDPMVQKLIENGTMSMGQARPLLALAEGEQQREVASQVVEKHLNARQVEKLINASKKQKKEKAKVKEKETEEVGQLLLEEMVEKVRKHYGTKVLIKKSGQEGKIELYFYSEDDLERLTSLLLNNPRQDKDA